MQRSLEILREKSGDFMGRGLTAPALPRDKRRAFKNSNSKKKLSSELFGSSH
nr:hypothetical protein [Thermococcus litoralis]